MSISANSNSREHEHSHSNSMSTSGMTLQDLSLESLPSFSTPARFRIPSLASVVSVSASAPGSRTASGSGMGTGMGIGSGSGTGMGMGTNPINMPSDRKSTRLNSSHSGESRMPSSA